MQAEERKSLITEHLRQAEFASLEELSLKVNASVSTVRRDLISLEANPESGIRRTHGGARLVVPRADEYVFSTRRTQEANEKESIATACAALIGHRQSLILDAGSTVFHVAGHLGPKEPLVFTNSLPVANLFASSKQAEIIISGGVLYPRLGVLVGPLAERAFSEVHVDTAILGGSGITADGVYNSHALLIGIQQAMIRAARKVIFCLDHTKFGRKSMSHVCGLEAVDCIVTDAHAPAEWVETIRARGVEVVLAPMNPGRKATGPQIAGPTQ